jgi:hypothetical protein
MLILMKIKINREIHSTFINVGAKMSAEIVFIVNEFIPSAIFCFPGFYLIKSKSSKLEIVSSDFCFDLIYFVNKNQLHERVR